MTSKEKAMPLAVKIMGLSGALLILVDGRILSRTLLGAREIANVAYGMTFLGFLIALAIVLIRVRFTVSMFLAAFLFCSSFVRLIYVEVSPTIALQLTIGYLGLIGLLAALQVARSSDIAVNLLKWTAIANAVVLLEPSGILKSVVLANTAYSFAYRAELGASLSDAASFTRDVGLYNSPGFLATLAAVSVGMFVTLVAKAPSLVNAIACLCAIVSGVLSGNRSFIVIIVATLLFFCWRTIRERRFGVALSTAGILVGSLGFVVVREEVVTESMLSRLAPDALAKDIDTRLGGSAGILPAIEIFLRNPLFGAYQRDSYADGSECVQDEFATVRPHMSIVQIFASRGLFVGLAFLWLAIRGLRGYKKVLSSQHIAEHERLNLRALQNGFLFGALICLSEPLLEFGPVLIALSGGLHVADRIRIRQSV